MSNSFSNLLFRCGAAYLFCSIRDYRRNCCSTAVWKTRDESANFQQKHDSTLIKEQKRIEVETEVRIQVDELMREELNNLKMVCKAEQKF